MMQSGEFSNTTSHAEEMMGDMTQNTTAGFHRHRGNSDYSKDLGQSQTNTTLLTKNMAGIIEF